MGVCENEAECESALWGLVEGMGDSEEATLGGAFSAAWEGASGTGV